MAQILWVLLLLAVSLFGVELKTYNTYERDSRVDLMLSFDAPYSGEISQSETATKVTLLLSKLSYPKKVLESLESQLVKEFSITPTSNTSIKIEIIKLANLDIIASKTIDGYGLRIRSQLVSTQPSQPTYDSKPQTLGTQASFELDSNYYIVMGVLVALLIVLIFVKRSLTNKNQMPANSWLFNKGDEDIKVTFKKQLDAHNSVALVEAYDNSYLIVIGSTNIMLDRFSSKKVSNEGEFQEVFEQNRKKLENYLGNSGDRLKTYKDKVSQA
jgi:hypothetical protein